MNKSEISHILASAGLRPQHHFGQNFMIDQNILAAIADAGDIHPTDLLLEIGPGVGNLTRLLAARANEGHVLAVDIDAKLLPAAKRHHHDLPNVTWLNTDALAGKHELDPTLIATLRQLRTQHPQSALKLVSNLPYNAASPLVANLLMLMWHEVHHSSSLTTDHWPLTTLFFARLAFTVQHEVALRMASPPNSRDYGPLSILIQSLADIQILRKIPPGAFWPPPKIHSALVLITPSLEKNRALPDAPALQSLLHGLFSHRRQTLSNALKHHLQNAWTPALKQSLLDRGFPLSARPENLPIPEFHRLAALLPAAPPP
ncbi:MAG TPA: 16S rRNA (adenine(1518)-N(6)/adenine(1519)-N(6))-dimethyltransferase RsmA [Phycisphaerae bacterium]|nr:16S rRNA (adenine(1518)-N(6)/adenine(1519)-N(6))-dimethyltransferase RsmA [Phycisphaerae bacterium]